MNETTIVYNSQKSGYLAKCWSLTQALKYSAVIERRLALWKRGGLDLLLKEVRFIQGKFVNSKKARTVEDVLNGLSKLVLRGILSAAMKLLGNESSSGLLDLSSDVLRGQHDKQAEAADIAEESLFHGPVDYIPQNVYDLIDEEMIYNSVSKTKGSAGLSGMDSELYRRIHCSKNFKTEGKILREEISVFTRNLLKKLYHPFLLEAFTSYGLIPLDKNPGIRPVGVGEVLRRIVGKMVSGFLK